MISKILNTIIEVLFNFTGDLGVAIVLITLIVKLILSPLDIQSKVILYKNNKLREEFESIKEKYKNNKDKMEEEQKKYEKESLKNIKGCLGTLIQIPVVTSLYFTVTNINMEATTLIVPWVINIKEYDNYFFVPLIYILISLAPTMISHFSYFKDKVNNKIDKKTIIPIIIINLLISIKAPVALGIYFITSSLVNFIQELGFRLYIKNKKTIY
ncbi:membrane protein insertase YidC [Clostridium hydrogeniformans]|uniref:membrane protein insertase YidC n=1 Tax=Clostridium hydrogeniformans TaxID=349933 RepID=UPI000555DEE4|nr:membrane protein insertase YidC [Clostridium hydrogeniformans]